MASARHLLVEIEAYYLSPRSGGRSRVTTERQIPGYFPTGYRASRHETHTKPIPFRVNNLFRRLRDTVWDTVAPAKLVRLPDVTTEAPRLIISGGKAQSGSGFGCPRNAALGSARANWSRHSKQPTQKSPRIAARISSPRISA